MKAIKFMVGAVLMALSTSMMAETIAILDYPFPSTTRGFEAVPTSETAKGGALGDITVSFSGTFSLRTNGIRYGANDATITLSLPEGKTFAAGDKLHFVWDSQTTQTTGIQLSSGGANASYSATDLGQGYEQETDFYVGTESGQLNAVGQGSIVIKRVGAKSVDLKHLTITGSDEGRDKGPDIVTPTWITVTSSMVWDWSKAAADPANDKILLDNANEVLLDTVSGITTDTLVFDARAIILQGENALRNGNACQVTVLKLKVSAPGTLKITMCNVGDEASKGVRFLCLNGDTTTYSVRSSEEDVEATLSITAGEQKLTGIRHDKAGNQAIRIKRIEYIKGSTPTEISDVNTAAPIVAIYTLQGHKLPGTDIHSLSEGIYVIQTTQGSYKIRK